MCDVEKPYSLRSKGNTKFIRDPSSQIVFGKRKLYIGYKYFLNLAPAIPTLLYLHLMIIIENYLPLDLNELASKDGVRSGCFSCLKTRSGANGAASDTAGRESPRVNGGRGCSSRSRLVGSWWLWWSSSSSGRFNVKPGASLAPPCVGRWWVGKCVRRRPSCSSRRPYSVNNPAVAVGRAWCSVNPAVGVWWAGGAGCPLGVLSTPFWWASSGARCAPLVCVGPRPSWKPWARLSCRAVSRTTSIRSAPS